MTEPDAITDIRTKLAAALQGIEGVQAYDRAPGQIDTPAAVIAPDSITYDVTLDGAADYLMPIYLLAGLGDMESAQITLDALVAHDGAAVRAINTTLTLEARVEGMDNYGITIYAETKYLGARLMVRVLA